MFKIIILDIIDQLWPVVLVCTLFLAVIRIIHLVKKQQKFILYKEVLFLLSFIYIIFLFHVVTFSDVSWSTSNFTPFKEMFRYEFGSKLFLRNVIGNMLIFIPLGFFIGYILRVKNTIIAFIVTLVASFIIETTQYYIGRVFDVDDIMLNVFGGMIGFLGYKLISAINSKLPSGLKKNLLYNILLIVLIGVTVLYLLIP